MDICFLPAWFYDTDGHGGGVFFREQAIALQKKVGQVDLFYPALHPRYLGKRAFVKRQVEGLAEYIYQAPIPPKRSFLLYYFTEEVRRGFERYVEARGGTPPDLIHAHSFWGAYAALIIKRKWGIPFIYTEHLGRWSVSSPQLNATYRSLLPHLLREAVLVTAVSSTLLRNLMEVNKANATAVTPNLVDTIFFHPLHCTKNKQETTKGVKLISIGDPWWTKGVDTLLAAIALLPMQLRRMTHLSLVDEFPKRASLESLIAKLNLQENVSFHGRLDRTALRTLLQQQDILISASRRESFGVTMIEALACGIPVIATRTAGALDIMKPELGLLVNIDQPAQLAQAIEQLSSQRQEFVPQQLAKYAGQYFGLAAFCQRWLTHYQFALNNAAC